MPKIKNKNWRKVKLGDVAEKISSGGTPSRLHLEYFTSDCDGHLWVKSKELLDVAIENTEEKITDDALNNSSVKYYPEYTILIAMYGANVGQLGWLKKRANVNQAVCGLIIDKDKADWRYVFYSLLQNRDDLIVQARGAAQQNLNQNLIKNFEIPILELKNQRNVGSVLSAYDELIENNTKRIKILEEIAQTIYKEWFIKFNFPVELVKSEKLKVKSKKNVGYKKAGGKMINSKTEFGKIPEGWEVKKIKNFVDLLSGFAFKSNTFVENGKYKVITIKAVHDGEFKSVNSDTIENIPGNMPKHCNLGDGDILLSLTGNVGRICLVYGENLLLNQRVAKLNPKKSNRAFIYSLFRNIDFKSKIKNLAVGAAQQNLSPVQTVELSVIVPDDTILCLYENRINPLLDEIINLNKQNQKLRQARDLLLPKLVSGEIEVKY